MAEGSTAPSEDEDLRQDLIDGENVGAPQEGELERIVRQMRQVQRKIEQQEVSTDTQALQQNIVNNLDALIKKLQRQKQRSQSSGSQSSGDPQIKQPDQQPNQGQQRPSKSTCQR